MLSGGQGGKAGRGRFGFAEVGVVANGLAAAAGALLLRIALSSMKHDVLKRNCAGTVAGSQNPPPRDLARVSLETPGPLYWYSIANRRLRR